MVTGGSGNGFLKAGVATTGGGGGGGGKGGLITSALGGNAGGLSITGGNGGGGGGSGGLIIGGLYQCEHQVVAEAVEASGYLLAPLFRHQATHLYQRVRLEA